MNTARVGRLTEADWRTFAALRLRALADTLGVDDSQHREESAFTAAQWRRRLRAHAQFAAFVNDRPVGLIAAQRDQPESVYLYSLWLEPQVRGRGLARTLLSAALDWARTEHVRIVTLRVHRANAVALNVYERLGFGVVPVATSAGADELTMTLSVE